MSSTYGLLFQLGCLRTVSSPPVLSPFPLLPLVVPPRADCLVPVLAWAVGYGILFYVAVKIKEIYLLKKRR